MLLQLIPFIVALAAVILLIAIVLVSILSPKNRIWPPPKNGSWQQTISWAAFAFSMFGVPIVGVLDIGSFGVFSWISLAGGCVALAAGFAVDLWGTKTLSAQQSLGQKGKIIVEGPYRYTRNPQYVGFILIYAGIIATTSSWMALTAGVLLILAFLILPFSEEPWLREQYGKPFEDYCKAVPRFVSGRTFRPTMKKTNQ